MADVRNLIGKLAEQEARLQQTTFLAPCVGGGSVRTRIEGLIYIFTPDPPDFEGWGLFRPVDAAQARLVEEADLRQIEAYLTLFPSFRVRLAFRLQGRTWLAYPANTSDARQRLGAAQPLLVHLVEQSAAFEQILIRWDGSTAWFEADDRRAAPHFAAYLREAFQQETEPEALRRTGLTPEMRAVYGLAFSRTAAYQARRQHRRDEARLSQALAFAGGQLQDFQERGDFWLVEWVSQDGEVHRSAISKRDLSVVSAGLCLDGRDQDFDLQSLVRVIDQRPDWM